uniref:hypothetical protein n=1 Tax=Agathobacter sp. TaxID=2021311 RepID=UPI0040575B5E
MDVEVDISDLSVLEGQLNNLKNQVDATSADAKNTVDDVTADISWEERKKYEVKAILINCTNKGEVISKKDCAGAICGQMDNGIRLI